MNMFLWPGPKSTFGPKHTLGQSGQEAALASLGILEINSKSRECFLVRSRPVLNGKCLYSPDGADQEKHRTAADQKALGRQTPESEIFGSGPEIN